MISKNDGQGMSILIVGGGVAGITAALDLAHTGTRVHLVEQTRYPGGQVARLDKIYPTDHCAFCPLWTKIKTCTQHPLITVYTRTRLEELRENQDGCVARIVQAPVFIDPNRCIFCGRCLRACLEERHNQALAPPDVPIQPVWEHAVPPAYAIEIEKCIRCGSCLDVCPPKARAVVKVSPSTVPERV